jgi:hypothetical protein
MGIIPCLTDYTGSEFDPVACLSGHMEHSDAIKYGKFFYQLNEGDLLTVNPSEWGFIAKIEEIMRHECKVLCS